jgi:cyclopropane-fatty-acyl-phospholipid synthase
MKRYKLHTISAGGTLREAQLAKLDAMLAAAEVCAGDHVLEIGCGWGSMAIHAVQTTGCRWGALLCVPRF